MGIVDESPASYKGPHTYKWTCDACKVAVFKVTGKGNPPGWQRNGSTVTCGACFQAAVNAKRTQKHADKGSGGSPVAAPVPRTLPVAPDSALSTELWTIKMHGHDSIQAHPTQGEAKDLVNPITPDPTLMSLLAFLNRAVQGTTFHRPGKGHSNQGFCFSTMTEPPRSCNPANPHIHVDGGDQANVIIDTSKRQSSWALPKSTINDSIPKRRPASCFVCTRLRVRAHR